MELEVKIEIHETKDKHEHRALKVFIREWYLVLNTMKNCWRDLREQWSGNNTTNNDSMFVMENYFKWGKCEFSKIKKEGLLEIYIKWWWSGQ